MSITLCILGYCSCLFCRLLTFFFISKLSFSEEYLGNTSRVSIGSKPDRERRFVGPDLDSNLCNVSADDKKSPPARNKLEL